MRQTNSADLLPPFHVEVVKLMMIDCHQGQFDVFFPQFILGFPRGGN